MLFFSPRGDSAGRQIRNGEVWPFQGFVFHFLLVLLLLFWEWMKSDCVFAVERKKEIDLRADFGELPFHSVTDRSAATVRLPMIVTVLHPANTLKDTL